MKVELEKVRALVTVADTKACENRAKTLELENVVSDSELTIDLRPKAWTPEMKKALKAVAGKLILFLKFLILNFEINLIRIIP